MKTNSIKKWIFFSVAVGTSLAFGIFQAAPWAWREIPKMRGIIFPIIVTRSKSWHGSEMDQIVQKLGKPRSKAGSVTMNLGDKSENFYYTPIILDQSFPERDTNKFSELVNMYCRDETSIDQKISILDSLKNIGSIQDFRNHFQRLRSAHALLVLEERWIYDIGDGKFDRGIRLIFDDSRKLKSLETFWKDGK